MTQTLQVTALIVAANAHPRPLFWLHTRGHGTRVEEGRLVASVCGVVQKVSKLVTVKPLRSRYSAEVGDVVVGRIMEVRQ